MKIRETVWAWAEVNAWRVRGVYGCVRHDPGVTNLFVAAEWILYHFNCSPLWTLLSIVLAYALLRCSPLRYQRWTRGLGLRRWSVFWPFVTLCHLVTLCDTLWQCNTVTGGVLRRHRVVTWPRVAAALVSVPPLATIVTTRHWHSDISSFSFIVTIRVNIVWEIQSTGDNGRMENVNCYSRFNMKTGNLSLLKYFTCRTSIIFW